MVTETEDPMEIGPPLSMLRKGRGCAAWPKAFESLLAQNGGAIDP
jgi:hypothetical protein